MTTRYSAYQKRWLLDKARGIDRGLVPAGPVSDHLAALKALGVKLTAIANLTGCSKSTLRAIAANKRGGCERSTAHRVLAVTLPALFASDRLPLHSQVPAIGAQRRIRALQSIGHTFAGMRAVAGVDVSGVVEKQSITLATHRSVVRTYDVLSMTPGPSRPSRTWAAKRGWPPPLAWDDDTIDDPSARPLDAVEKIPGKRRRACIEDVEFLAAAGEPWEVAAHRLNTIRVNLERRLYRLQRQDLIDRFYRNSESWSQETQKRWTA